MKNTRYNFFEIVDTFVDLLFEKNIEKKMEIIAKSTLAKRIISFLRSKKYIFYYNYSKYNMTNFEFTKWGRMNWSNGVIIGEFYWIEILAEPLIGNQTKAVSFEKIRILRDIFLENLSFEEIKDDYSYVTINFVKKIYNQGIKICNNEQIVHYIIKQDLSFQKKLIVKLEDNQTLLDLSEFETNKFKMEHLNYLILDYHSSDFVYHIHNIFHMQNEILECFKLRFSIWISLGEAEEEIEWQSEFEDLILYQKEIPYFCSCLSNKNFYRGNIVYKKKVDIQKYNFNNHETEYIIEKTNEGFFKRWIVIL